MKIRQGFVSNSSSSSFCIYGVSKEESEIIDALVAKGAPEEEFEDGVYEYLDTWSYDWHKKEGKLTDEDKAKFEGRFLHPDDGFEYESIMGECHFIGISWKNINDDETGAEFKARIEAKMTELFGEDTECSTHEEAWRDG